MERREELERMLVMAKCELKMISLISEKKEINNRINNNPNPMLGDYAEAIVDLLILKAQIEAVDELMKKAKS